MKFMLYLSDLMIPFLLFGIIGFGLLSGRDVYQDFLDGAREGLKTIASICPTLIGLDCSWSSSCLWSFEIYGRFSWENPQSPWNSRGYCPSGTGPSFLIQCSGKPASGYF